MIQRLFAFLVLCCLPVLGAAAEPAATPAKPQKTIEERYLEAAACLQQSDPVCAQVTLAGLPPSSPYAKILDALIAATQRDDDRVLRLLIPLQHNNGLLPQATASLHATLAQAYENQGNVLRALEEYSLIQGEDPDKLQQRVWSLIKNQPRAQLLELRGESQDSRTQGWIDLALAAADPVPGVAVEKWRTAYPEHPASAALLQQISQQSSAADYEHAALQGVVALLIPLDEPAYRSAADAVHKGLLAARGDAGGEIRVYASKGSKEEIVALYQQALADGAQYVVGPMARAEVSALAASGIKLVPTLALNTPDGVPLPENMMTFGLPVEREAIQAARNARAQGMQSAMIIAADTPLAARMAQAFLKEWQTQEGTLIAHKTFGTDTNLAELKSDLAAHATDMIFLAANADQARLVRPYLDSAIPTFATSHIFDGVAQNPENLPLSAIHFVDMPWMIDPDHPDFAPYHATAGNLPPGRAQRWFAVGVDAWNILAAKAGGRSMLLAGLSGTLHVEGSNMIRELPMAQFRNDGVAVESDH